MYLEGKAFCKGIAFSVGEVGPKLKEWLPVLIFSFLNLNLTVHRTLNTHTVVVTYKPLSVSLRMRILRSRHRREVNPLLIRLQKAFRVDGVEQEVWVETVRESGYIVDILMHLSAVFFLFFVFIHI